MNSSPQRQEQFFELQSNSPKLVPIQDVRTRWNSTFLMLRRAKRLRPIFDQYCLRENLTDLMLDQEHWRQIDYLLWITQPFFKFTTALSKSKDITVHSVFGIYNTLFDHLEKSINQLRRKKVPWKKTMLKALEASKQKLGDYYHNTKEIHGDLFAIATILAPQYKLQFFSSWAEDGIDYSERYQKSIRTLLTPYQQRLQKRLGKTPIQSDLVEDIDVDLDSMIGPGCQTEEENDEFARYIQLGMYLLSIEIQYH